MNRTSTLIAIALLVAGIAVAAVFFLSAGSRRGTARITRLSEKDRHTAFVARFDSLTDARLLPVVWRSGSFLNSGFDEGREEWSLTVSSRDWKLRDEASKKDLAATLYSSFQAVRAQAGGDPDPAVLIIENEEGEILLRASLEAGIDIRK
jgi:hypothetical protein